MSDAIAMYLAGFGSACIAVPLFLYILLYRDERPADEPTEHGLWPL